MFGGHALLPVFVIFFREALEASVVVGVILAYLERIARPDAKRAVWLGILFAVAIDSVVAMATFHLIRQYDGSRVQAILEGSTYLVATVLLTYMSFWMKGQSGQLREDLEGRIAAALGRGSVLAMAVLSAVTVGREGLETAFFTLAIALHAQPLGMLAGAVLGLGAGLWVSYWIYRLGRRVPLGLFFNVLGVLLLLFGAGLLADAIESFQSVGLLPLLQQAVWHSGTLLSEASPLGDILHSFFGYADAPSLLQFLAYLAFLIGTVLLYLRPRQTGTRRV